MYCTVSVKCHDFLLMIRFLSAIVKMFVCNNVTAVNIMGQSKTKTCSWERPKLVASEIIDEVALLLVQMSRTVLLSYVYILETVVFVSNDLFEQMF